jgi:hypothetical protein
MNVATDAEVLKWPAGKTRDVTRALCTGNALQVILFHLALPRGDSATPGTFSPTICIATPVTLPTISA